MPHGPPSFAPPPGSGRAAEEARGSGREQKTEPRTVSRRSSDVGEAWKRRAAWMDPGPAAADSPPLQALVPAQYQHCQAVKTGSCRSSTTTARCCCRASPVCSFWIQGLDGMLYPVASGIGLDVVKNIQFQCYMDEKQYRTTMAVLPSSVVAGRAFEDHGAETTPSGMCLVGQAARPVRRSLHFVFDSGIENAASLLRGEGRRLRSVELVSGLATSALRVIVLEHLWRCLSTDSVTSG